MQEKVIPARQKPVTQLSQVSLSVDKWTPGKHLHEAESSCRGHERVPSVPPSQQFRSSFRREGKGF